MTLSRRGDYVMRSAILLARAFDSGESRKIREVVAETAIPATFASQILADLVRARLAASRAGRDGGYRLLRPPEEISVLEVVEAAEGPLHAERCALGDDPCRWEAVCPLHETWTRATAELRELLAATTLAEVARRDAAIEAGTYRFSGESHRSRPSEVEVADRVEVETSLAAAHGALVHLGPDLVGLVTTALTAAGEVRPLPPAVEATLEANRRGRGRSAEQHTYRLEWQAFDATETAAFAGELTLSAVDADRCELRAAGRWRHEARANDQSAAEIERHAHARLRSVLRVLARSLDAPHH